MSGVTQIGVLNCKTKIRLSGCPGTTNHTSLQNVGIWSLHEDNIICFNQIWRHVLYPCWPGQQDTQEEQWMNVLQHTYIYYLCTVDVRLIYRGATDRSLEVRRAGACRTSVGWSQNHGVSSRFKSKVESHHGLSNEISTRQPTTQQQLLMQDSS